jgi:hypothetical protein
MDGSFILDGNEELLKRIGYVSYARFEEFRR